MRFTRLKLIGADTSPNADNDTCGISASGKENVRVDHCELFGFRYHVKGVSLSSVGASPIRENGIAGNKSHLNDFPPLSSGAILNPWVLAGIIDG